MTFHVPLSAENTINWLKAHGYNLDLTADMVEKIDIYGPESQDTGGVERVEVPWTKDVDRGRVPMMTVTDKEKIEKILQNYHTSRIDYNNSYEIRIYYTPRFDESEEPDYDKRDYERGEYQIFGYLNQSLDFLD